MADLPNYVWIWSGGDSGRPWCYCSTQDGSIRHRWSEAEMHWWLEGGPLRKFNLAQSQDCSQPLLADGPRSFIDALQAREISKRR